MEVALYFSLEYIRSQFLGIIILTLKLKIMEKSKFLKLNAEDFFKGLLVAVVTAILTAILVIIQSGLEINKQSILSVLYAGGAALVSYLLKNLFTNNKGEILTSDK